MLVFAVIVGVIITLNVVGFIINTFFLKDELKAMVPYGQMVDINGNKMHIHSMGNGEKTIVLLPGLGVSLPSADFGPLMRKLSNQYTVVAVEYFGIGFSELTDTPRINENYTNEIRTALDKAGFKPPYTLMPHSASGVYSEYYATKYPEEVSGIIMLDTTSTAVTSDMNLPSFIYSIGKLQQATGFTRLVNNLVPETKLIENGYTEKEKADFKLITAHASNDTVINQAKLLMENIKEVNKLSFPSDIPVLKIVSKQSVERMAKKDKDDGMGYQNSHLNRLGENVSLKVVDATHFLYQTKVDEIVILTNEFFDNV